MDKATHKILVFLEKSPKNLVKIAQKTVQKPRNFVKEKTLVREMCVFEQGGDLLCKGGWALQPLRLELGCWVLRCMTPKECKKQRSAAFSRGQSQCSVGLPLQHSLALLEQT